MFTQTLKTLLWFALAGTLGACAHNFQLMKMEEQISGYGAAIRWSQHEKALGFLANPPAQSPDWRELRATQVTGYTVQAQEKFPSGNVMTQTVEIRYLPPGSVVEKVFVDHQRWRLDDDSGRWLLETDPPPFFH